MAGKKKDTSSSEAAPKGNSAASQSEPISDEKRSGAAADTAKEGPSETAASDREPRPDADEAPEKTASKNPDQERIETLIRERDEYLDNLKRERASFLNHKRWVEKERRNWEAASVCRFVEKLLPFIDDMDRAVDAAREATDLESLGKGFEMICNRFRDALKTGGVEEIPSNGEPFDPKVHEAILQVEDADQSPGTVLETTHQGYRLGDRLIRAAKVVVSKAPQPSAGASPTEDESQPATAARPDDEDDNTED